MNVKIGALIVTFNPDLKRLSDNINAIHNQVDVLVIVDNDSSNKKQIEELIKESKIEIIELDHNMGIAAAQNIGMNFLQKEGATWGITLDQDSIVPLDMVSKYTHSKEFNDETTGILALQYLDPTWNEVQRRAKLKSKLKNTEEIRVIASGNMVRIDAWRKVGGFDEWMFIDQVDFDFDAKVLLSGYKIWQINDIVMFHEVGKVIHNPILERLLLFPKKSVFSDHSSFREYYIQRNTIVHAKRYPEFRRHRFQVIVSMIQSRRILVYSAPRLKKLSAAWKGIIDGMKYNPKKDKNFQKFRKSLKGESD